MNYLLVWIEILLVCVFSESKSHGNDQICFIQQPTYSSNKLDTTYFLVDGEHGLKDTVFVLLNQEEQIHSYFRNLQTEVCPDSECRILRISIYWSVTGRYLGFKLPPGEFLSKLNHAPFRETDYERLHQILSNQDSPLSNYTIDDLVPKMLAGIDGISRATVKTVKDNSVDGAVYTTYTIWHQVNGKSQRKICEYTLAHMNSGLLFQILDSPVSEDIYWGLKNFPASLKLDDPTLSKIFECITREEYVVANEAVDRITPEMLSDESSQLLLLFQFENSDDIFKRKIIEKLRDVNCLYRSFELGFFQDISRANDLVVGDILDLYRDREIREQESLSAIMELLEHEQSSVAEKAYKFLSMKYRQNRKVSRKLQIFSHLYN